MDNKERKFRITNLLGGYGKFFGRDGIEEGSIICIDEVLNYMEHMECSREFISVESFNRRYITQIEEIFDWPEKEYTIDELEEGVEYIATTNRSMHNMIKDGKLYFKLASEDFDGYRVSHAGYNDIKRRKFTKVQLPQPIKQYTFDEAKADCIENGEEYVSRWKGKATDIQATMERTTLEGELGIRINFHGCIDRYYITAHTTWVKKSDLDNQ